MRRACCSNIVSAPYDGVAAIALDWLHGVEWQVGAVAQHVGAGSAHAAFRSMRHVLLGSMAYPMRNRDS